MARKEKPENEGHHKQPCQCWAGTFKIIGVTAVLFLSLIYVTSLCMRSPESVIKDIAHSITSGKIVTEFRDYVTKVRGLNYLQVASLESVDTFSKTHSKNLLWNSVSLPDVEVHVNAPINYTYYLDLKEKWEFTWQEHEQGIMVIAPKLQWNKPAIDVSQMSISIEKGSAFRDEEEVKELLMKELTRLSEKMAEEKIPLIRELARRETRLFIQNWFINVKFANAEINPHIQSVYFANEKLPDAQKNPLEIVNEVNEEKEGWFTWV